MLTRGVVFVHSAPLAVCPHVEWAITRALTAPVQLRWSVQPRDPSCRRTEVGWTGPPGTGARIAAELRRWPMLRFEVTEEPSPGVDGERFMYAPGLGLFRATAGAAGDIQLGEDRLRALIAAAPSPEALAHTLITALGTPWDEELEPYRRAAEEAPVPELRQAG